MGVQRKPAPPPDCRDYPIPLFAHRVGNVRRAEMNHGHVVTGVRQRRRLAPNARVVHDALV
jgi:hypothetical protein